MKAADRKSVEGMLKLARKETRRLKDDPGKLKKAQKRIRKLLSYLEVGNCNIHLVSSSVKITSSVSSI